MHVVAALCAWLLTTCKVVEYLISLPLLKDVFLSFIVLNEMVYFWMFLYYSCLKLKVCLECEFKACLVDGSLDIFDQKAHCKSYS